MSQFALHQQVLQDMEDMQLAQAVSAAVLELKRRALLSKSYLRWADLIAKNAIKTAGNRAAGLE